MATKISLINMKGGVGKSTLAVNLAWMFAGFVGWDKKVLVIDVDPQFNASQYLLGVAKYKQLLAKNARTMWDVFEQLTRSPGKPSASALDPSDVIQRVVDYDDGSLIDLIPSRLELAFSLRNPNDKEPLLGQLVSKIETNYDLILVDCPPTESLLTTSAYLVSDKILVPVKPDFLCTIGLPLLVNSIEEFRLRHEGHQVEVAGIVFNAASQYPEEEKSKKQVRTVAKQNGWYVFDNEIPFSRSFPTGARTGKPLFDTSHAPKKRITKFKQFTEEFARRIGL
ncbi:MAG: ParA family protein [Pseudomonadota bacterium]